MKDIALHLLDDDLGWLSRGRDRDASGLLDPTVGHEPFVAALARKNQSWVDGSAGLSRRVVCDLLRWSAVEVDTYLAALDLTASARVSWAAHGEVPLWLEVARDYTERWVHQQQIRDALGRSGTHADTLDVVLRTFVWAFPHQYAAETELGTAVAIDLTEGGRWLLTRGQHGWELDEGERRSPAASITVDGDTAWRLVTGGAYDPDAIRATGPDHLVEPLLDVRGIIA